MSEENVKSMRRVQAAINRGGDAKLAEELVEPDARFEPLLAGVEGGTYRGPAGIMKWMAEMNEMFSEIHAEYSEIEDLGDVVLARSRTTARGRGGGVPVELSSFLVIRFREGRMTYAAVRRTRAEALEAVGLGE